MPAETRGTVDEFPGPWSVARRLVAAQRDQVEGSAAHQAVREAEAQLKEASRKLPEWSALETARARARSLDNLAIRVGGHRIEAAYRLAQPSERMELLLALADRVTAAAEISSLGMALTAICRRECDPLLSIPVIRRLIARATEPGTTLFGDGLEVAARYSEKVVSQIPFRGFLGEPQDVIWAEQRVGSSTYRVATTTGLLAGEAHDGRTPETVVVLAFASGGHLVAARADQAAAFFAAHQLPGRGRPARSMAHGLG
jgi:hypothetical protein